MNSNAIDYFFYGHPLTRVRSYFAMRARRNIFNFFMCTMQPSADSKIIDLGVTTDQSLPESNFFEELYPHKSKITAVSIEDAGFLENRYCGLKFIKIEKGEKLPFCDNCFDILFCSAVIEHVGDRESQIRFIMEALRIAKSFFLITPNRQFPLDIHTMIPFLHWLPLPLHQTILGRLGLDFWSRTENLNLLTPSAFITLFPKNLDLGLAYNKLLGLPSNIIVYGRKFI